MIGDPQGDALRADINRQTWAEIRAKEGCSARPEARERAYDAVDGERDYQDSLWPQDGTTEAPNPLTIGEFVLMLEEYAAKARAEWIAEKKPEQKTLHMIRKIAGIAVNCMEQHGAPRRGS